MGDPVARYRLPALTEFASHAPLAFAAGLLSVLSPCVMPLMPAYLSLISGISVEDMEHGSHDAQQRRRVMRACTGFVLGFSAVFILMGVGAVAVGHTLRTWRLDVLGLEIGAAQIAGALIVLLGLHMTGLIPIAVLYRDTRMQFKINHRSFLSTFLVGQPRSSQPASPPSADNQKAHQEDAR